MKFTVRFNTKVENGLILWIGDQDSRGDHRSDFLLLGLSGGELHFRFNLGGGEVDISYNETSLSDGEWHEVTVRRTGKRGELIVDGMTPIVRTVPGKLTQLNTNTGLYVGEFKTLSNTKIIIIIIHETSSILFLVGGIDNLKEDIINKYTSGLVGCISRLVLDTDYDVKLMAMSTAGRNVQHCN